MEVYPESFIISERDYGTGYLYLSFLEGADELTDEDEYEIVTKIVEVFKNYMKERE